MPFGPAYRGGFITNWTTTRTVTTTAATAAAFGVEDSSVNSTIGEFGEMPLPSSMSSSDSSGPGAPSSLLQPVYALAIAILDHPITGPIDSAHPLVLSICAVGTYFVAAIVVSTF